VTTGTNPRSRGPFSWAALGVFAATGAGLYWYFENEKSRLQARRAEEAANQKVGRPDIGGAFVLDALDGSRFTEKDLLGRFTMLYFGFTNCPDICPEELDKMGQVVETIEREHGPGSLVPIFVTVDPARDTPAAMRKYLRDFHPSMIGLRGDYEATKRMCKTFRVYFSTPPNKKPTDDYLVDHSIFFYLMSPEGRFVDAFGKIFTKDQVIEKVDAFIAEHKDGKTWGDPIS